MTRPVRLFGVPPGEVLATVENLGLVPGALFTLDVCHDDGCPGITRGLLHCTCVSVDITISQYGGEVRP